MTKNGLIFRGLDSDIILERVVSLQKERQLILRFTSTELRGFHRDESSDPNGFSEIDET